MSSRITWDFCRVDVDCLTIVILPNVKCKKLYVHTRSYILMTKFKKFADFTKYEPRKKKSESKNPMSDTCYRA